MAELNETSMRKMLAKLFIAFDILGEDRMVRLQGQVQRMIKDAQDGKASAKLDELSIDALLAPTEAERVREQRGLVQGASEAVRTGITAVQKSLFGNSSEASKQRVRAAYNIPAILAGHQRGSAPDQKESSIMLIMLLTASDLWYEVTQNPASAAEGSPRDSALSRFNRAVPPPPALDGSLMAPELGMTQKDVQARERAWLQFMKGSPRFDPFVIISQIFLANGKMNDASWLRFYLRHMAASYATVLQDLSALMSNRLSSSEMPRKLADLQRALPHLKYINSVELMPVAPMSGGSGSGRARAARRSAR